MVGNGRCGMVPDRVLDGGHGCGGNSLHPGTRHQRGKHQKHGQKNASQHHHDAMS